VAGARPSPAAPPADAAAEAPKLTLQALVYAEAAAERMVFINGQKYREGDVVQPDVVLERITEEGVVLRYKGQRLVLRDPSAR
jgi:hypothetical protein